MCAYSVYIGVPRHTDRVRDFVMCVCTYVATLMCIDVYEYRCVHICSYSVYMCVPRNIHRVRDFVMCVGMHRYTYAHICIGYMYMSLLCIYMYTHIDM